MDFDNIMLRNTSSWKLKLLGEGPWLIYWYLHGWFIGISIGDIDLFMLLLMHLRIWLAPVLEDNLSILVGGF